MAPATAHSAENEGSYPFDAANLDEDQGKDVRGDSSDRGKPFLLHDAVLLDGSNRRLRRAKLLLRVIYSLSSNPELLLKVIYNLSSTLELLLGWNVVRLPHGTQ